VHPLGIPDTKRHTKFEVSIAQVVFEILRSKRIGVTTHEFDLSRSRDGFRDEIFNVKCNATVQLTLIRPLNKGQGHSFWYQSISHI